LFKQNNEAKLRRSTKSIVVGKAKVMSFGDIVAARSKRIARDAAKDSSVAKEKPGRKRKDTLPATRKSEIEVAANEIAVGGMKEYCSLILIGVLV
jgi:hypothetical protein